MDLNALVVWPDERGAHLLEQVLEEVSITTEWTSDSTDAANRLLLRRYDCILLDCAPSSARGLLREVAACAEQASAIVVAFLDPQQQLGEFMDMGASLVLYQPLVLDRARSTVRVARSLMRHEKRRTRRVAVAEMLHMQLNGESQKAFVADISEGGLAMTCTKTFARNDRIRLLFALPEGNLILNVTAEVASRSAEGRYGLRFLDMPHATRRALRDWILARLQRYKREGQPSTALPPSQPLLAMPLPSIPVPSMPVASVASPVPVPAMAAAALSR